ncbi:hypothetical protein F2Q70_00036805 [Brassica cretica]|uniref:Uncharacterized protein n=1 Tax=Brassica cretica TaxID=69181 RepID=A0A8S9JXW8_BRACR|nr:hypothetical protein F2Q68_00032118 [Brassica cretica]KAF2586904.1 hypothetical protein F2Q70_00036805 [Brassica cretica]
MAIFKPHNHHPRSLARIPLFSSGLVTVQPSSLFDSLSKTNATKHSQTRQKISPVLLKVVPFDQRDDMATVAWLSDK